jgi:hypothetical protein
MKLLPGNFLLYLVKAERLQVLKKRKNAKEKLRWFAKSRSRWHSLR